MTGLVIPLLADPLASDTFIHPSILGATTCSTSGCHGGAGEKSNQYALWSQRDVHSRAYATLTTARSARMAEALRIPDATTSTRCTTCHAPLQAVQSANPAALAPEARVTEGVSCVSCHGPGGDWVRSHTRTDLSRAEKIATGLKDLENLHTRAGSCVACHQVIDPELVETGRHPRLIFELDGQTASQPRHWKETPDYNGAQAWQVGQAVALREVSWAMGQHETTSAEIARWQALLWVLQRVEGTEGALGRLSFVPNNENYTGAQTAAYAMAKVVATTFNPASVPERLKQLAGTSSEFGDRSVSREQHAYRAERLVLALDRLLAATPAEQKSAEASDRLDALFASTQSIPDFAPDAFARELTTFLKALR